MSIKAKSFYLIITGPTCLLPLITDGFRARWIRIGSVAANH